MATPVNAYVRQRASALSAGITIVRKIIAENSFPQGFTTKQIYELAQKHPAPKDYGPYKAPMPYLPRGQTPVPRPDHPIRSITYVSPRSCQFIHQPTEWCSFLKKQVLPALQGFREINMVHQPKSGQHEEPDLSNLRPVRREMRKSSQVEFVWKVLPQKAAHTHTRLAPVDKVVGREVGVGADTSHLNKRRQRARVRKVTEAVIALKSHMHLSGPLAEIAKTSNSAPQA